MDATMREALDAYCVYFAEQDFALMESLPDTWWQNWLPALLVYHGHTFGQDDTVWCRIVETGHRRCPEGFYCALRLWLQTSDAVGIDSNSDCR